MLDFLIAFIILLIPSTHTVVLSWQLSEDSNPAYQSIYRQIACTGPVVKVGEVNATAVEWTDKHVVNGKKYCYYVTVRDRLLKESSIPSNIESVEIPLE